MRGSDTGRSFGHAHSHDLAAGELDLNPVSAGVSSEHCDWIRLLLRIEEWLENDDFIPRIDKRHNGAHESCVN